MRVLKEPLLYFLLAGFALFVLYYSINPEQDDNAIVIDQSRLLTFIQYRSKAFSPELAKQRWQALDEFERKQLLRDYYEEELLYREAMRLDLSADDYIIKRRLVQKMDFIIQSQAADKPAPSAAQLNDFMQANAGDYTVQPYVSFTHVYFPHKTTAADSASAAAKTMLAQLNRQAISFDQAGQYGERFLYHRNYIERTRDYIAAHFGESFAQQLFAWPADDLGSARWIGPIQSDHGQHLLLVSQRQAAYQPKLEQVQARVEQDFQREQQRQQRQQAVQALAEKYPAQGDHALLQWLQES